MDVKFLHNADRALTIEFGDDISLTLNRRVHALNGALRELIETQAYSGLIETVPTFRSLTLHYDPLQLLPNEVEEIVTPFLTHNSDAKFDRRHWLFPCCYTPEYGEDLVDVAQRTGLKVDEVIELHSRQTFDAYMIGFLPGFGFLGSLPEQLRLPRRTTPRTQVPKGSVAIADQLSAVYPSESPGGWHLIGRTPIEFFNPENANGALLRAGDQVRFQPISTEHFNDLQSNIKAGRFDIVSTCLHTGGFA